MPFNSMLFGFETPVTFCLDFPGQMEALEGKYIVDGTPDLSDMTLPINMNTEWLESSTVWPTSQFSLPASSLAETGPAEGYLAQSYDNWSLSETLTFHGSIFEHDDFGPAPKKRYFFTGRSSTDMLVPVQSVEQRVGIIDMVGRDIVVALRVDFGGKR
jgi:hypothetical protein